MVVHDARFFDLPLDFGRGWQACPDHVCSGVVRGRLRLSHLFKTNQEFVLKIWELNHNNNNNDQEWLLVHNVTLETEETDRLFVAAFHPYNEDVICMFNDHDVYKYKIGQGKFKNIRPNS
ncbi:hypothetical protein PanWU01x14_148590 [Parasponia andersonii]|uniref:F-box associated domain-containing protein n=1 Tax=Parasponia andersonii TaxID=3476 RepID=A0A2P5CJ60_PARAD|nr:hypothetical protein PanWU01x14_148590 [Parasponia andersonii]